MNVQRLLVAAAVAGSAITSGAGPAAADHDACGSGHGFHYAPPLSHAVTGTTDSYDRVDFWHDRSEYGPETLRLIVLTPVTGDTDLYVWSSDCSHVICSSAASVGPDECLVSVTGSTYVEARYWGGSSSQYTLSVTYSPFFV